MADLGGQFDATTVEPNQGRQSIPGGKYRAAVVKSEWKETNNKKGKYLLLVFEIMDGEHRGSRVESRLNLQNPSADAVRIAKSELSAICHATGVMKPKDSAELHNIPLYIQVAVTKFKGRDGEDRNGNEIKKYESTEQASQSAAAPAAQSAGGGDEKPPWA